MLKLFFDTKWQCLCRYKKGTWYQLYSASRYWCADPFIVQENGQYYVFCEMMDMKTSHGVLGVTELNLCKKNYVRPIMDFGCHISYPNIFKVKDLYYMIPETSERKTIELYKAIHFPYKWEKISILKNNLHAVDTTVFEQENKYYVFVYEPNGAQNILSIAELDMESFKLKNITKVKEYASRIGRPAGNVIKYDGKTYRPTQYGVNFYGEKIIFKEFKFDPITYYYEENDVTEFNIKDIELSNQVSTILGCHTYNNTGDMEIIDIKYKKFSFLKPVRSIFKYFNIGGYKFAYKR